MNSSIFRNLFLTVLFGVSSSFALEKPNIILILADDMGPGEPSHMGGLVPTPAIDSLAAEGMRFTDAHTSSSVCTPTRYGLLTGRYNWRSRLKRFVLIDATEKALMDPKRLNMPAFLKEQNYHTGMIGKWHLGADFERLNSPPGDEDRQDASWKLDYTKPFRNGPADIGFDQSFFVLSSLDVPPYVYLRDDKAVAVPTENGGWPHNEYNDFKRVGARDPEFDAHDALPDFAREAREYIKVQAENEAKPFFLFLSLTSPHTPITPSERFKGKYPQYSHYADFIAETDWVVGEVIAEVTASGIGENTMIIYTSDNGFAPYVKIPEMLAAGYKPSGDWRGDKATIYEGGHRVPFLVRWPAGVEPGTTSDVTVCTTDFYATFADLLGARDAIPPDAAEDSFSFLPALHGFSDPIRPFTIHHSLNGTFAIRKGDWKLIFGTGPGGGWSDEPPPPAELVQLFNLAKDPAETRNLEAENPAKVAELVDDLAETFHRGRTTPGPDQSNDGWPMLRRDLNELAASFPQLAPPDE
ncbi:arylsulfatase [Coraliomargarita sinensis]|uniref:Arylsulfatase n=1 Tax=Coraliomargarita sinensis TaxID=2174842 RepID=A0A317ZMS1_9BACT|nr:arylsulfatase [Coraliomargarita sinensis]PXA04701.1 arylsulfatase [Coraliomargarita sinensis]